MVCRRVATLGCNVLNVKVGRGRGEKDGKIFHSVSCQDTMKWGVCRNAIAIDANKAKAGLFALLMNYINNEITIAFFRYGLYS